MLRVRYVWTGALVVVLMGWMGGRAGAAFTLTDNGDLTKYGTERKIRIVAEGQFELSFWGSMHGSIDHVYDLVNDPGRKTVMNDHTVPARNAITKEGTAFSVFGEIDYNSHNGYLDQTTGLCWAGSGVPLWEQAGLTAPIIELQVLEDNAVRKVIRMKSIFTGYDGKGTQQRYDQDRLIEREYSVYADGAVFIKNSDTLVKYPELGTADRGTFTIFGVNSSMDTFRLAGGGATRFEGYQVPWDDPPVAWVLHFGHPATKMTLFASQYGDFSIPWGATGKYQYMRYASLAAGVRLTWAAASTGRIDPGPPFTKCYYLQFGTEGSTKMPTFAKGSGPQAHCDFALGDSFANDYRSPAALIFSTGVQTDDGYDESEGVYTLAASANAAAFTLRVGGLTRHHPRFRVAKWEAKGVVLSLNGAPVDPGRYTQAKVGDVLLVHYFGDLAQDTRVVMKGAK